MANIPFSIIAHAGVKGWWPQHDAQGYLIGASCDYGSGSRPGNCGDQDDWPDIIDGFIPRKNRTGDAPPFVFLRGWEQVENHKGESGYVDGEPYTMQDYGPYLAGWSKSPPPPTREEAVAAKLTEIMSGYSAAFVPIEAVYPREEREGWPIQLEEARAVLADPDADALTLAILVAGRGMGETVAEFAHLVLGNNMAYRAIYGTLTSQQQRMYRDVESMAATPGITAADIAAYPVEYVMPDGL